MVYSSMKVLGIMSGTSLDGLDLALVELSLEEGKVKSKFLKGDTIKYSAEWEGRLKTCRSQTGEALTQLHTEYGRLIGEAARDFGGDEPDLIASHGHTVFHQPDKGFTLQIGSLFEIAQVTGIKTVGDFRSLDVAKGGQGAPLVPIGDELLYGGFDYCINLGGISNFSFVAEGKRLAKDLSPCNIVSNYFARQMGMAYDKDGLIGRKGKVHPFLLRMLNEWGYYSEDASSLGIERIEEDYLPIFEKIQLPIEDKLRTYYEHLGVLIGKELRSGSALFTGGGVKNTCLMDCIKSYSSARVEIPTEEDVDFKEAIIFALLGYLRVNNQTNILASVTGASSDSCSGLIVEA